MRSLLILLILATLPGSSAAQEVAFVKADQIAHWREAASDTVYVINFWATWCGPCLEELPWFEKLHREYAGQKVKVVLVSMDFKKQVDQRVRPFVKRKKLKSEVVFMDERTPNKWINSVNPDWSGAIPATWIVGNGKTKEQFFEKQMTYPELETAVKAALVPAP
jgi:thiol-disulfide isomerase/thioredoxin